MTHKTQQRIAELAKTAIIIEHEAGIRVAYKRTFVITHKDGTRTEEVLKTVWKVWN